MFARSIPTAVLLLAWLTIPVGVRAADGTRAAAEPTVQVFSPRGVARQVRQVTARFSEAMVALGDPRLADPFIAECAASGQGRWADERNWVYDFDATVPAGVRCTFALREGLTSARGAAVTGQRQFEFSTGGPAIVASYPREGASFVDEEQVFLLRLDAPATVESVTANAYCSVEGIGEKIPLDVLTGEAREAVLRNRDRFGYQYFRMLTKDNDAFDVAVKDETLRQAEASMTLARCRRALPPATKLTLHWGAGIRAASGIATTRDQALHFRVRPAFVAQAECTRVNARAGCLPMLPITIRFSAPVPRRLALGVRLKLADGRLLRPDAADQPDGTSAESVSFPGPFPELTTATVLLPPAFVDDAGRALENAGSFPLAMRVDELPPLAKFSGTFGILEAREGGVLPVTVRNLEPAVTARQAALPARVLRIDDPSAIRQWLERVAAAAEPRTEPAPRDQEAKAAPSEGRAKRASDEDSDDEDDGTATGDGTARWREATGTLSVFGDSEPTTSFQVAKPAGGKSFEVIGIPLKEPGFYVVELESRVLGQALLGRDQVRYVSTAALVTNLAVHLKLGRESSLAWVTRLDDGKPVAGAEVVVAGYCGGPVLWRGETDRDGIASIAKNLGKPGWGDRCAPHATGPFIASARKDGDFSFVLSSWDQGISPYQFHVPMAEEESATLVHTVFDRPLFRAGETVSMKHFWRRHVMQGFALPEPMPTEATLLIEHPDSGQSYRIPVRFARDGTAESQWKIPPEARLGDYVVSIVHAKQQLASGGFKVEEFRLPSMRATVTGPGTTLVQPSSADLDLHVAYLSGGSVPGLPVTLRTVVEPRPAQFAAYDDYQFGGPKIVEGLSTDAPDETADADGAPAKPAKTQVIPLTLDANGSARVAVRGLPALDEPAVLTAELEYADANGEILTSAGQVRIAPAALAVGIRREGWAASREQVRFRVVVVDLAGHPQPKHAIQTALYQVKTYSYRKRLIGGFYAYETTRETRRLAASCNGVTDAQGLVTCEVAPGVDGEILVRAETRDGGGRIAGATTSVWVVDHDDWWFGGTSGDRMDVLPERKAYEAGESARLQVRMPFREATALVTVEREGVLSGFVTHLSGRNPLVTVPLLGHYAPNVYVSVLAVRGRVAHPDGKPPASMKGEAVSALVDLNKPAFRLGIAALKVGWKPHRLDVTVATDRPVYPVRDHAAVTIHVARADGTALPAGTEVAVAAVDAALLELAPNPSWDLLSAMMGERGLEVATSTAQMQVVGKRHYGRKAVPAGGGGGRDRARELFDTLLTWKGRVALDGEGNATVSVPLNDSLSEFRIVAIASGGTGLFGTGSATITTTQDLVLLSGLAPVVREGDRYAAMFTLRNASQRPFTAEVTAALTGGTAAPLAAQRVELAPGQSRDLSWPVTAPPGVAATRWEVTAREAGGSAADRLRVTQTVIPAYPVRTYQSTLRQLTEPYSAPAARPAGAVAGRGGLEVTLRAHLGDGLDGVREFATLYPYTCIEQQVSRAIMLRDKEAWARAMARLPAFLDRQGLLRYFASDALPGDDALSAYVLSVANEAGWEIPEATRERLLDALKGFVAGRIVRTSALPTADLTVRKLAAIEALARYGQAERAMLGSLSIEPDRWPTSAVLDWIGILDRVPQVANAATRRSDALGILRTRLNFQGTVMGFSTERSDALWWLMISADSNANRLLLAVLGRAEWRGDVPRLVRGSLARQQRGHWNTTVANAWGVLAMEKYSAAFESVPVAGATTLRYAATSRTVAWPVAPAPPPAPVTLPWANTAGTFEATHAGTGAPWLLVRATAALPLDRPLSSGFRIKRSVTAVEQHHPDRWSRGDVVRVRLDLEAQSDMTWVVVDDPVPAGATILGNGTGGQSTLLARGERREGRVWTAFEERRFDAFRAYYRYVPKGAWTVEYTVRLNNPGTFQLPATRVEAMYAPEMLGEAPNAAVTVEP